MYRYVRQTIEKNGGGKPSLHGPLLFLPPDQKSFGFVGPNGRIALSRCLSAKCRCWIPQIRIDHPNHDIPLRSEEMSVSNSRDSFEAFRHESRRLAWPSPPFSF